MITSHIKKEHAVGNHEAAENTGIICSYLAHVRNVVSIPESG